jgi:4-amino-4-deoxy-L-arabinose transferase-like glycosyltransferase
MLLSGSALSRLAREHIAFLVLWLLVGVLLFADLGGDYLWADEGDTAVLASAVLDTGVPRAWDGVTFSDSDLGQRVNDDLVMVSHPWLQYYVVAASFAIFGETTFAARLPFAIAGWLTLPLLYALVLRVTGDRRSAWTSALLLGVSVQFLLFARQSRNYALYTWLACALVWLFLRLRDWKGGVAFAGAAIALFHTNPAGLALVAGLGLLTLLYRPCVPYRRWFWRAMPLVGALTVPWLFIAQSGYAENTDLTPTMARLGPRLLQFLIEWASVAPAIGVVVLLAFVVARHARQPHDARPRRLFTPGEHLLLMLVAATFVSYAAMMAVSQSRSQMWSLGLRYAIPALVMTMAAAGVLAVKASAGRPLLFAGIVMALSVTQIGRLQPWTLLQDEPTPLRSRAIAMMHVPTHWLAALIRFAPLAFARDLVDENPGTLAAVSQYLNAHASPGDIVITNYEWEPLYFHTQLPQGFKILPQYPIRDAARRAGLPDYVFSVRGARWVVWRWPWDGYQQYRWDDVSARLRAQGATLVRVKTVPETAWENRANVHFRRFPGRQYLFETPQVVGLRDADIYRVDWPPPR